MGVLGCLVSTQMFAWPPWNSLCAFDWEEEPIVCMEMELTDGIQGRQEQSWSPIGSGTRLWLTSWQGREAQRSYWIYHGTKRLWFISVNLLLLTWNSSYSKKDKLCSCFWTTVDRVVGAEGGMKKVPHIMFTVLEKQFRLFALDRFCRKSAWVKQQRYLDEGCVPLLPKVFCCIFIWKVSKNVSWCVLNGSYLLTL